MPRSDRRRSFVTLAVWSVGFVAVVAVAAWQFGWLPTDEMAHLPPDDAQTELTGGSAVPFQPVDGSPAGDGGGAWSGGADSGEPGFEAAVFEQQSEPEIEPNPDNEITHRGDDRRGRLWDHVRETPNAENAWPPAEAAPHYSAAAEPAGWLADGERAPPAARPSQLEHAPPGRPLQRPASSGHIDPTLHEPRERGPAPTRVIERYSRGPHVQLAGVEELADDSTAVTHAAAAAPEIDPGHPAARDLAEIDRLIAGGDTNDIKEAHRRLSTIFWKQPDWRPLVQKRIDQTAESIYFANLRHYMEPYVVEPGDQLSRIAGRYQVSWQYLERLNNVPANRIRPGQRLKVIKGPFAARVDLSDMELTVHAHGWYVRSYRVGIGRDGSTPIGKFTVQEKLVNPTYYRPPAEGGGIIAADDPNNPLGEYWIGIGNSYGIHGTIDPQSIGRAESRGCLRLLNEDVAQVFDFLVPGSEVVIQP
ncbi:MAG TPA: L,D-transpeptidase family protein [Planctomycetaceae bacterium]|nr:L,D-transpeptidase family protein [Planctomycetaceae bacterium]